MNGFWILVIGAWANYGRAVSVSVTPGLSESACKNAVIMARASVDRQASGVVFANCVSNTQ